MFWSSQKCSFYRHHCFGVVPACLTLLLLLCSSLYYPSPATPLSPLLSYFALIYSCADFIPHLRSSLIPLLVLKSRDSWELIKAISHRVASVRLSSRWWPWLSAVLPSPYRGNDMRKQIKKTKRQPLGPVPWRLRRVASSSSAFFSSPSLESTQRLRPVAWKFDEEHYWRLDC